MRGTLGCIGVFGGGAGIIPAYAGNTRLAWLSRPVTQDHPRVCGEHTKRL